uniref:Uncharacterized protein n=1 Tax=Rhizophora mucronata TaxID=61149 RepID=A0A2P2NUY0_RHIMU
MPLEFPPKFLSNFSSAVFWGLGTVSRNLMIRIQVVECSLHATNTNELQLGN